MSSPSTQMRDEVVALLPRLRRFARTLTRDRSDADDVVQIAVERALVRHDQWRPGSRLDSWLFGIVRNAWIDEVRARSRRSAVFAPEEAGEHIGNPATDEDFDMRAIRNALFELPEEQRCVVSLVLIEGLSYQEAADALEIPIGTVTSRLARGRATLQTQLAQELAP